MTADELAQVVADQAERNGLAVRDVLRAVALAMGARELQDGDAIGPGQMYFDVPDTGCVACGGSVGVGGRDGLCAGCYAESIED